MRNGYLAILLLPIVWAVYKDSIFKISNKFTHTHTHTHTHTRTHLIVIHVHCTYMRAMQIRRDLVHGVSAGHWSTTTAANQ